MSPGHPLLHPRCQATALHRGRCRNQTMDVDPDFCHRHSPNHAYERCGVIDRRSGRPCNRKAVESGEPCAGHMPVTVSDLSATERRVLMSGSRVVAGHETGRFKA